MLTHISKKKFMLAILAAFAVSSAHAQFAGVTAGVAANQAISGLNGVIDNARDTGDYLSMRAAMEAKGVIEAWKEANKDLLDVAFEKLSEQQRSLFNNARQVIGDANTKAEERLVQAEAIVNQGNQLMAQIPYNKTTFVTQFYPRVLPPQAASTFTVKVKGVNLDAAAPELSVAGVKAQRMIIGPMEVHYTLDLSKVPRDPNKLAVVPLTLTYNNLKDGFFNRLLGNREQVDRQIPVIALPTNIGYYSYTAVAVTDAKVVKPFSSQPQRMEGRNTNKRTVARPPEGWQWDWAQGVGAFRQSEHGGRAGSCHGIFANESSKDGITHGAHLDERREMTGFPPRVVWGGGHVSCAVNGPIFQMEKREQTLPVMTGQLTWTEDMRLAIPSGLKSHTLEVTLFDGRKRVFTGSGHDKFFNVLNGPGDPQLVIQPTLPKDI